MEDRQVLPRAGVPSGGRGAALRVSLNLFQPDSGSSAERFLTTHRKHFQDPRQQSLCVLSEHPSRRMPPPKLQSSSVAELLCDIRGDASNILKPQTAVPIASLPLSLPDVEKTKLEAESDRRAVQEIGLPLSQPARPQAVAAVPDGQAAAVRVPPVDPPRTRGGLAKLDVLYSSPHTRVCRSTLLSSTAANSLPYESRGWPSFETSVSGFKEPRLILEVYDGDVPLDASGSLIDREEKGECRSPEELGRDTFSLTPRAPQSFDQFLDTKTFTNGSDNQWVKRLYRRFVRRTASTIREFHFANRRTFTDADLDSLTELLSFMRKDRGCGAAQVESIDLSGTPTRDAAQRRAIREISVLPELRQLDLHNTGTSSSTLSAINGAMKRGGFLQLNKLALCDCEQIGDESVEVLIDLLQSTQLVKGKRILVDVRRVGFSREGYWRFIGWVEGPGKQWEHLRIWRDGEAPQ
uniref:Uncharacterized protein n=1 Tax=Chromera velia CCMP2878 TaxID=1169474 RepID=A0A0G4HS08_9ALVE|eukprot:Cvel_30768.t1-p1 / transcript=Cvel_30768.t1 / gene=Cvel_30768 / organism=Chromera_velia_CCMP2878 / gene_product=hypothetical protein / transcript_product=hypothetical protein / location=Cvel_scaffold4447:4645-6036(-) / protein_length=464 / sequence_SO=supercontig / SO=protein_coding / is_pseudo=false